MYIYKPVYNLVYIMNINYMYIFRDDDLALDIRIMCSFLDKTISSIYIFPPLSIVLCRIKALWLSPIQLWHV